MSTGAIIIMTYLTIFFGFGCVLVIDDAIRQHKKKKPRSKAR